MNPKGLLVISSHGQEFLLVPEERSQAAHYTLSILQQSGGQWVRLQPQSASLIRESMLGALLEFFGNLCRILNQTHDHAVDSKHLVRKSRQALPEMSPLSSCDEFKNEPHK